MSYDKNVQGGDWAPADNWVPAKDWAPATELSYLGNFKARGESRSGDLTWADTDPPVELSVSAKGPEDLKLGSVIGYATEMDKDIDGGLLNKNATKEGKKEASSAVKEGEEKFIYGAAYSGLQGISISDSTGLVAAYTRGAKVDWMKGNKWTYQEGGWVVSDVNVSSSKSTTNIENEYEVELNSKSSAVSNITQKDSISLTRSGGVISRESIAELAIVTTNTAGAGIVTVNTATAGMTTNNFTPLGILNNNVVGGISNALNVTGLVSSAINVAGVSIATMNITNIFLIATKAKIKITRDYTNLSMTISENDSFSAAKNNIEAFKTAATKAGIDIKDVGESMSKIQSALWRHYTKVAEVGNKIEKNNNSVVSCKVRVDESDSLISRNDCEIIDAKLQSLRVDNFMLMASLSVCV